MGRLVELVTIGLIGVGILALASAGDQGPRRFNRNAVVQPGDEPLQDVRGVRSTVETFDSPLTRMVAAARAALLVEQGGKEWAQRWNRAQDGAGYGIRASPDALCAVAAEYPPYMTAPDMPDVSVLLPIKNYAVERRMAPMGQLILEDATAGGGRPLPPVDVGLVELVPYVWRDPRSVLCEAGITLDVFRRLVPLLLVDDQAANIVDVAPRPWDNPSLLSSSLLALVPYLPPRIWVQVREAYEAGDLRDWRYVSQSGLGELLTLARRALLTDWRITYGLNATDVILWRKAEKRRRECAESPDTDGNEATCGAQEGVYWLYTLVVGPAAAIVGAIL